MLVKVVIASAFITLTVHAQVTGHNAVVDLSHWNANIDFAKAKADGILGVIHKSTQGLGYVDPQYAPRKTEALAQGIKWGGYHFANGSDGADQAKFYLRVVGDDPNTLLALDLEENPTGPTVTRSIAEDFVKTVYEATGRYPLIYGSRNFLSNMVTGTKSVLLDCPLWFAQWADQPNVPENTWLNWTLWQYTDGKSGPEPHTVDGIGACDRDTINAALHSSVEDMWERAGRPQAVGTTEKPMRTSRMPGRSTSPTKHRCSSDDSSEERTATRTKPYSTRRPRYSTYLTTTDRPT